MEHRNEQHPPTTRSERVHADAAAEHILALITAQDPTFEITPDRHDAMTALVLAVARAVGGAR